jgi:hypothetical protein
LSLIGQLSESREDRPIDHGKIRCRIGSLLSSYWEQNLKHRFKRLKDARRADDAAGTK